MKKNETYFEARDNSNVLKIRELLLELPEFCSEFIRGIEGRTTPLTRLGYVRDIKIFLEFLISDTNEFQGRKLDSLTYQDLDKITSSHLEMYMSYLNLYRDNSNKIQKNGERARSRKLSSVRSMLKYFFRKNLINSNVADKVEAPKVHEQPITRLEIDEVVNLLNLSEDGCKLTERQQSYHKHTKLRDYAMLSLFLGTGIRISECVGLNINDIYFDQNAFKVTRKGGSSVILYFNDEVADALKGYLQERVEVKTYYPNEQALFLSIQNKRISVRAVEKLVKKYSELITPLKHITPHKLRSTFGTNLYRETNDIYVVADVLGHKDVNTTRKHYAAISEDIRRTAATKVKLRED